MVCVGLGFGVATLVITTELVSGVAITGTTTRQLKHSKELSCRSAGWKSEIKVSSRPVPF